MKQHYEGKPNNQHYCLTNLDDQQTLTLSCSSSDPINQKKGKQKQEERKKTPTFYERPSHGAQPQPVPGPTQSLGASSHL